MQVLRREPESFLVLFTESQNVKPWNAVAKLVTSVGQLYHSTHLQPKEPITARGTEMNLANST